MGEKLGLRTKKHVHSLFSKYLFKTLNFRNIFFAHIICTVIPLFLFFLTHKYKGNKNAVLQLYIKVVGIILKAVLMTRCCMVVRYQNKIQNNL